MMTNGWQEDSSVLSRASIALIKRENASLVAATGLIFERLKETSQDISLQDTLVSYKGGTWGDESVEGVGYPVLRSSNMRGKRVDVSDAAWCNVPAEQAKSFSLESGDILVIKSSGSIDLVGKAALFNDPNDGNTYLFSNFTMRLRPDRKKVIPEYLAWFLRSPQAFSWRFEKQQTTVGLRNLQSKEYLSQVVPIPNLDIQQQVVDYLNALENGSSSLDDFELPEILKEQRRIVARIEALAARVNEAQRLREEAIAETKSLYDATLLSVFEELKTHTKPKPIGETNLLLNNETRSPQKEAPDEEFLYVDIAAVENGTGKITSPQKLLGNVAPSRARRVIKKNDIILSTVRPNLRAFAIVPPELDNQICSTGFAVFTCPSDILPHFMLYQFFSPYFLGQAVKAVVGGHYPALNDKAINSLEVVIPPLDEQRRIVAYLDGLQAKVNALRELQSQTGAELEALMPSILDKAFKGEL